MTVKPYREPGAGNQPSPFEIRSERYLRDVMEDLLRTYDEVTEVWPQSKGGLWAKLKDGRTVSIECTVKEPA